MKNSFLVLLIILLLTTFSSCALLKTGAEGLVVTDANYVIDLSQSFPLPLDRIPEEYRETYKDVTLVMTREENLKEGAVMVPLTNPTSWDSDTISTVLGALLIGLKGFFPWLAGLEGLLALIIPRKRQHYASAVKNVATLELKEGLKSLAKGLGLAHSSTATKNVWEANRKAKASLLSDAKEAVETI